MNVSSVIDSRLSVVVKEGDEICHLWRNKSSEFLTLCQCLHVLEEKSGRGDNFSKERIYCLSMRILIWKSSSCSPFLKARVARSDWTLPFVSPRWWAREWRSLDRIVHPGISWEWVLTTLQSWDVMEDFTQVSLVIATNSECPREVYTWRFQE